MFIVRVQTGRNEPKVQTFSFETERDMNRAAAVFMRMKNRGFGAKVDNADDVRGKILTSWDRKDLDGHYWNSLERVVDGGRYRDSVWEWYGSEIDCAKRVADCDKDDVSYFSTHARMENVAGNLFKVTYTTPYND